MIILQRKYWKIEIAPVWFLGYQVDYNTISIQLIPPFIIWIDRSKLRHRNCTTCYPKKK